MIESAFCISIVSIYENSCEHTSSGASRSLFTHLHQSHKVNFRVKICVGSPLLGMAHRGIMAQIACSPDTSASLVLFWKSPQGISSNPVLGAVSIHLGTGELGTNHSPSKWIWNRRQTRQSLHYTLRSRQYPFPGSRGEEQKGH